MILKDQNCVEFDTPCPHWHDPNNPAITETLDLTFGLVLVQNGSTTHDPQGVLSLLFANMAHHSDWMLGVLEKTQVIILVKSPFSQAPSYRN